MNLPLYMQNAFDYPVAMAIATVLGFFFGFVLERSGFGRAMNLAAQFYGRDMRVLKVMFGAIVTTTIGLGLFGGLGALDMSLLAIPETYMGPQIVGGLLLGVGFIVSGYCPGTAVVATATGNLDGIVSLIGVMLGSVGFALLFPVLEQFYNSGHMGPLTFPELLGVPWAVVALGVAAMAVGAFAFAEVVEGWIAKRNHADAPDSPPVLRRGVYAGLAGGAALGLLTLLLPTGAEQATAGPSHRTESVEALQLASDLLNAKGKLYVLDVRAPADCQAKRIPGAMCLTDDDMQAKMLATFPATRTLVVYDADGSAELPEGVFAYAGPVRRLRGGYAGFEAEVLSPPEPPSVPTPDAITEYRLKVALQAHYTGAKTEKAPVIIKPKAVKRAVKKGGGC